jgi:hypothetical protein
MESLTAYDFKRPSSSQYDDVAKALVDDGATAVRIKRGADFPDDIKMSSVQQGVRDVIKKRGRRARTRIEDDNHMVIGLWPEGEGPRTPRRRRGARAVVNA